MKRLQYRQTLACSLSAKKKSTPTNLHFADETMQ